ncbi:hypothetical protein UA08_00143 [Talaromyces atroroseus]|uniref:Uncharacterized protein n=1 Tax=Talaromyces atroroseus TaxID=1441469 RepID=A0A225BB26_TALAT|nr:hypothetical protein UA08_00143 [Talaromyces atroroseus]OKL64115.1 hypothetical protein UA08_00143 [Talaromyces atroroseus]
MMRTSDPRIRQTLNNISHNLESANESAQEGFYRFSQQYLAPCFASIGNCLAECTAPCLPNRETQARRRRRGRAELNFDFYDDWDNESANDGILGWGNDELDRLLAGSGSVRGGAQQPRRQRKMSYGAARTRRKSSILPDRTDDPTVIPKSSLIGFLERLPWQFGPRGVKYRPSAADLQERPGRLPHDDDYPHQEGTEAQPLIEEDEEEEDAGQRAIDGGPSRDSINKGKKNYRGRSTTQSSQDTSNSLSSRGDLIFDDEDEDAVPLDDEFAVTLARRNTGLTSDEHFAGIAGRSRRTTSAQSIRSAKSRVEAARSAEIASMAELSKEEREAEVEEELEVVRRRSAAQQLAISQGLVQDQTSQVTPAPDFPSAPEMHRSQPSSIQNDDKPTEPFPSYPMTPTSQRSTTPLSVKDQEVELDAEADDENKDHTN